jgi:hypothetical protein
MSHWRPCALHARLDRPCAHNTNPHSPRAARHNPTICFTLQVAVSDHMTARHGHHWMMTNPNMSCNHSKPLVASSTTYGCHTSTISCLYHKSEPEKGPKAGSARQRTTETSTLLSRISRTPVHTGRSLYGTSCV